MKINGIILAAGMSSRMEAFKPLLKLKDKTIIECSIDSMLCAGAPQAVVVLGHRAQELETVLLSRYEHSRLVLVRNSHYAEMDMLMSVKIGISALPVCDAFFLLPGDMPAVNSQTFLKVKETMVRSQALIAFPSLEGHRKHPPLISAKCMDTICKFDGTGGLSEVWKQLESEIVTVAVDDAGCRLDADTRADYQRLVDYMEFSNS
ncbi:MAG TPA: nucleotidyltransferase family protein [Sporomusaceae bacterium]|nr:nucleotidyltransferase family protein [Sporomusaceae bacterium]